MYLKDVLLIALLVIFLWSINLIIQKIFSQDIPLEFFNLLRFLSCVPLLFLFKRPSISMIKLLTVSFFWNVLTFFLVGLGLQYGTGVGSVSFVYQTCSFFGVFFCFLLLHEVPKFNQIAGMLIAFSGIALLFSGSLSSTEQSHFAGLLFILFAAMSWGFGITLIKKFKLSGDLATNVWITAVAALPMAGMIYFRGGIALFEQSVAALSIEIVLGAMYAGYVANLLGNCLWFKLLKNYPSSLITPYMLLLPLISSVISYLFLEEQFSVLQISAFLIIVLGISVNQNILASVSQKPREIWKKWTSTN